MKLNTYEDTIMQAQATQGITDADFRKLSVDQSAAIVNQIEDKFVDGHNWYWWWEHLRKIDFAAVHSEDEPFIWLQQILPEPEANVWFVVEPFGEKKNFSVYEARARYIQPVLEESICFEYYIVAKDLSWLMGENHHGCFFCAGEPVAGRLQTIVEQNPEQWRKAN